MVVTGSMAMLNSSRHRISGEWESARVDLRAAAKLGKDMAWAAKLAERETAAAIRGRPAAAPSAAARPAEAVLEFTQQDLYILQPGPLARSLPLTGTLTPLTTSMWLPIQALITSGSSTVALRPTRRMFGASC